MCTGSDGAFAGMASGACFVDHTTVSAKVTRELYDAAKETDLDFVDAPISGGQAGAENAQLSIMCGGDEASYAKAEPVMNVYAKLCRRIGDSGSGQMTKMANQIAIAGLVQGLSEALHFAEKAGLDGRSVVEVISQGAAGSWQMSNRYETMIDDHFEHGFAVDWMRKDLGICLSTADENGASLPITALVDQFYTDVQKMGPRYLEQLVHADEKALMATERKKLSAINDGEVVENEYRFRHRQGNWRWLLCRETVFQRDEDGQPTQVFGTATDITKRKHAEVALKEFNEELERLARMDGLTQVANRCSFDEYLAQEWENVGSGRSALSLILCDIDYFKSFNDTYGHQAGDVCLRKVAKAIEKAVKRNTDLVARYGGEEFAIVLPNTNAAGVEQVAQEIQREIRTLSIPHSQSDVSDCITLSLGIASITTTVNAHHDMLVACADQGLYQAKYEGRDRYSHGEIEYP